MSIKTKHNDNPVQKNTIYSHGIANIYDMSDAAFKNIILKLKYKNGKITKEDLFLELL